MDNRNMFFMVFISVLMLTVSTMALVGPQPNSPLYPPMEIIPPAPIGGGTNSFTCTIEQLGTFAEDYCSSDVGGASIRVYKVCKSWMQSPTGYAWFGASQNCINNGPGWVCNPLTNRCEDMVTPECTTDDQCGSGNICASWKCIAGCKTNSQCPIGYSCVDFTCTHVPETPSINALNILLIVGVMVGIGGLYIYRTEVGQFLKDKGVL